MLSPMKIFDFLHKWEMKLLYSEHYKKLGYKCMMVIRTAPTEQDESYRSRLVHTEEVRKIALTLWEKMSPSNKNKIYHELNNKWGIPDEPLWNEKIIIQLITVIARAHDIGHPPFGHAGEKAIQHLLTTNHDDIVGLRHIVKKLIAAMKKTNEGEIQEEELLAKATTKAQKELFSHASHSTRIISHEIIIDQLGGDEETSTDDKDARKLKNDIFYKILNAVQCHGWKPWESRKISEEPETIIGQLVAISDQIASIISDLEELETIKYSDYSYDSNYFNGNRKYNIDSFFNRLNKEKVLEKRDDKTKDYIKYEFTTGMGKSASAYKRFDFMTDLLSKEIKIEDAIITIPNEMYRFVLDVLERDIRKHIQKMISWFGARDSMAIAIISALFNHIWARLSVPGTHTLRRSGSKYLQEFKRYFAENYVIDKGVCPKGKPNAVYDYYDFIKAKSMCTWDSTILWYHLYNDTGDLSDARDWATIQPKLNKLMQNPGNANKWDEFFYDHQEIIYIIALIEFIAYQTDEYCIKAFEDIYEEFLNADRSLARK